MTPNDIRHHQFTKTLRGYDPAEVTAFLESVSQQLEQFQQKNDDLARIMTELQTQVNDYRSVEKALQQALVQTQESSAKTLENARREAQLMISDAESKGSHIIQKAQDDLTNIQEQIAIMQSRKDALVARMKMLLHSELELLKALETNVGIQAGKLSDAPGTKSFSTEIDEIIKSLDGV